MATPLTPELEAQAQQLAATMKEQAGDQFLAVARLLVATDERTLFGQTEFDVRHQVLQLVGQADTLHRAQKKNGYRGSSIDCAHCGHAAPYHDDRTRTPQSLGGLIRCTRAYYYCRGCGTGSFPGDEHAGLSERNLTPALEQLTALTGGVADSFEKGGDLLAKTTDVRLSESTVQRTTEAVGERIAAKLGAGKTFGAKKPWDWHRDAQGRTVGYLGLDATGVPQQGPGGAEAEGRMAYVGMVYNPLPDRERVFEGLPKPGTTMMARYVSGLYPLAAMGPLLRRQANQVGLDDAEVWIALTDGGSGLEPFMEANFPRVDAVIVDFWHASQYVAKLASALHAGDAERVESQTQEWKRLLKDEGGWALLAVWDEWEWPPRRSGLRAVLDEVLGYFRNQAHRMEYPEYEANGWSIGSGAVESACKTVVGGRLKGAGMRWSEAGAHAVCHVRALYRSEPGQWESFWQLAF